MKKLAFIVCAAFILAMIVIIFTPLDTSEENTIKITGIVTNVYEGGVKDAVLELQDHKLVII
jgi:hypothetical protein